MESIGWGSDYPEELVQLSLAAYPFVAHARSESGVLWGYVSAFSDQKPAFETKPILGKIEPEPESPRLIKTVRGVGYACAAEVRKL